MLFAALLSLDSLGVGLACGMRKTRIPVRAKLLVALVSGIFAGAGCLLGKGAESVLKGNVARVSGGILLILAGILLFVNAITEAVTDGDRDGSGEISRSEAILMGFALSADMLGAGAGFACGGNTTWLFPIYAAVFQYGFLSVGAFWGRKFALPGAEKVLAFLPPFAIIVMGILKLI